MIEPNVSPAPKPTELTVMDGITLKFCANALTPRRRAASVAMMCLFICLEW